MTDQAPPAYSGPRRVLSGVQPSGALHLGNYLGALVKFARLQHEVETFIFVADMHAITVWQDPKLLAGQVREITAAYLASGLDPKVATIFPQSAVPQHAELAWIFNCVARLGWLDRMTQFKEKSAKHADNINAGLFTYPSLMAADILLYQTDVVPVGDDQKQHVELCRDVAQRFNNLYPDTFTIPEPIISQSGARIKSLAEPTRKMDKSDPNPNAVVYLLDDRDTIIRKFKRAVTDSETSVRYAPGKDGINNLMTIYSCFTGKDFAAIEAEFAGRGYSDFKLAVGEVTADALAPVQAEFRRLMADKTYIEDLMRKGAREAAICAARTLTKVKKKLGLVLI